MANFKLTEIFEPLGGMTEVAVTNFVAIGGIPATTGAFRLGNTDNIRWRNQANDGDIIAVEVDASDTLVLGGTAVDISFAQSIVGTVQALNAAGWALLDEASSEANPTIIPNKGNLTSGLGGLGGNVTLVVGGTVRLEIDGNGIGFFNITPVVRATAYTQTFATADKTHELSTFAAVVETASTQTTPFGYTTAAQADAIPVELNDLGDDVADLKALVNSVIDDLQAYGLFQ